MISRLPFPPVKICGSRYPLCKFQVTRIQSGLHRCLYTFFDKRKNDSICVSRWSFKSIVIFMGDNTNGYIKIEKDSLEVALKHLTHIPYLMWLILYCKVILYRCNIGYIFICNTYLHHLYDIFDVINNLLEMETILKRLRFKYKLK